MKYSEFLKKCNKDVCRIEHNFNGSEEVEKRNINLWMVYQTIETNRKLVWAT